MYILVTLCYNFNCSQCGLCKLNHGIFIFVNQIWKDDVLVKSEKLQNGAIYAAKLNDKWLYAGGWDKVVNIQVCLVALFI